jgi:beta-aspartyl-peptidase (threonine type)
MNLIERRSVLFLLSFALCACVSSQNSNSDPEQSEAEVRSVIEAQQAAWNRGDIDGFMEGYDRAETTTFVSGDELTKSWQTVLERYKRRYQTAEQMGTLAFSELEFKQLGPLYTLVDGRWQLRRPADTPHGRFTLLFHRTASGWRIIHDTTTSAEP